MPTKKNNVKFEDAVIRLEEIVGNLEKSDLSLEDSIKMFQEGMELAALCNTKLDEAEKKINTIMKNTKTGELEEKELDLKED